MRIMQNETVVIKTKSELENVTKALHATKISEKSDRQIRELRNIASKFENLPYRLNR